MKRSHKVMLVGVGLLLLLGGIITASSLASQTVFFTLQKQYLLLPGDKSGARVLSQAWYELNQVQTARLKLEIELETPTAAQPIVTSTSLGSLNLDSAQASQLALTTQAEATLKGYTFAAEVEPVVTPSTLFVKFDHLPDLAFLNRELLTSGWFKTSFAHSDSQALKSLPTVGKAVRQQRGDKEVFQIPITLPPAQLVVAGKQLFGDNFVVSEDQLPPVNALVYVDAQTFLPIAVESAASLAIDKTPLIEIWSKFLPESKVLNVTSKLTLTDFGQKVDSIVPENAIDISEYSADFILKTVDSQGNVLGAFDQVFAPPSITPRELQDLTPYQKSLLQQQGFEVEQVIP